MTPFGPEVLPGLGRLLAQGSSPEVLRTTLNVLHRLWDRARTYEGELFGPEHPRSAVCKEAEELLRRIHAAINTAEEV